MIDPQIDPHYAPGGYACHEALHMTAFLAGTVDEELVAHGAIQANPEWLALATAACATLSDLYQKIGAAHCAAPDLACTHLAVV